MDIRDEVIEIGGAPAKLLGLGLLAVVMTALCVVMARYAPAGSFHEFIGWVGALFFGAAIGVSIWRFAHAGQTVLRLDREGLLDRRLSRLPIPWSAIGQVATWSYKGQRVIVLSVPPETETAIELTRRARLTRDMNAQLEADGLCISATGLSIRHAALMEAIIARAQAAQQEAAQQEGGQQDGPGCDPADD